MDIIPRTSQSEEKRRAMKWSNTFWYFVLRTLALHVNTKQREGNNHATTILHRANFIIAAFASHCIHATTGMPGPSADAVAIAQCIFQMQPDVYFCCNNYYHFHLTFSCLRSTEFTMRCTVSTLGYSLFNL